MSRKPWPITLEPLRCWAQMVKGAFLKECNRYNKAEEEKRAIIRRLKMRGCDRIRVVEWGGEYAARCRLAERVIDQGRTIFDAPFIVRGRPRVYVPGPHQTSLEALRALELAIAIGGDINKERRNARGNK